MNVQAVKEKIKTSDKKMIAAASVIAVAALFGIVTMTFGKSSHERQPAEEENALSVTALTIKPTIVDSVVSAAGVLTSKNTSVLSSKVMGKIAELHVAEGDQVAQGKLLVRIESGEVSAQAYQALAAYNNAGLHYKRIKNLFEEQAATQAEMDQATLGFESAKAGLNAAKAMESYTIISAPIAGQVVEKKINLGEMALPGQPMLKIEDNRHLRLEVTVTEHDIRFVHPGDPVVVQIDALPGKEIKARIAQVVPASDPRTHSFVVKIDIPGDKGLITGMYGKALFMTGKREAMEVPKSAIVEMSGIKGVYLISTEGSAVFQMVQFGETHGDQIEAITGLKPGDNVIISRQNMRIDGRKVVVAQK